VESIYITHQLNVQAGIFSTIANKIHHHYIKQFNVVWVPDFENEKDNLAGKLSHHHDLKNVSYVGPFKSFTYFQFKRKTDLIIFACYLAQSH
jgi:hypothetical protein